MKYYIITYGCQMNRSDSERIAAVFEKNEIKLTSNINEADFIIVNACSVRQTAIDRIFGLEPKFKQLKAKNQRLKTILTGCVLPTDKIKLKKQFDYILDIKGLPKWSKALGIEKQELGIFDYFKIQPKYQNRFSAFVPISNGCDNFCAYCAVPYTKGRLFCRNHKEILKEIKCLVKKGYKEIWLLGQNVNNYRSGLTQIKTRKNAEVNFAKFLRMVNDIPGNFWIRFTSPHPKDFSDKLVNTMAQCKKVTPYLNLPVQSGDNEILRKMRRPYIIEKYKKLISQIRNAFKKYRKGLEKEVAISTDIIVGFPGETKKQFENTVSLFKKIKYDMAYIAKFSPRPGTLAAKVKDDVSLREKERRRRVLTEILKKTALGNNKKFIGKILEVLVEEKKKNFLIGKTRNYKTIKFKGPQNLVGRLANVKIEEALVWGLKGILVSF
ncbi:MAG: tRNA (N6-isopentenyl adenosine(37)-C2)-methylthiotransferase MiaB [Candidatus Nealsonbacteria bacterium CG23_combo_of_CG06-09_8_20_14_all_38_19]|uniref:tRNA-2-methylthio-N(6)-dimethylallyladenosine synthase n=1 Tax=Candidatus Nealsonbacteria bacterium CG23_combo_of_CG06-09_8_20_14_all_38_19 TaxID=1974721 RepID=A0A2G9YXV3_9BACT|nr:MAG: tRNA (N6-isopentenyl adenosine(37)-C2)-methylthiotransferase MiaB [Candidatus Nealsonbacteria bacterium CG23_combo_of_CG06-09_8_20_14_all_38_19]